MHYHCALPLFNPQPIIIEDSPGPWYSMWWTGQWFERRAVNWQNHRRNIMMNSLEGKGHLFNPIRFKKCLLSSHHCLGLHNYTVMHYHRMKSAKLYWNVMSCLRGWFPVQFPVSSALEEKRSGSPLQLVFKEHKSASGIFKPSHYVRAALVNSKEPHNESSKHTVVNMPCLSERIKTRFKIPWKRQGLLFWDG